MMARRFLFSVVVFLMVLPLHAGQMQLSLHEGRLVADVDGSVKRVDTEGYVHVAYGEGSRGAWVLTRNGRLFLYCGTGDDFQSYRGFELPIDTVKSFLRMDFDDSGVYILVQHEGKEVPSLHRIGCTTRTLQTRRDVQDFTVVQDRPVLLEKTGDSYQVTYRGTTVPVSLRGRVFIENVADNRLVFCVNGLEKEIIDVVKGVNLYRYGSAVSYAIPVEHNLQCVVTDEVPGSSADKPVFFRIFVNGHDMGRTESGLPEVEKRVRLMVSDNEKLVIQLERWELEGDSGRYRRANNIRQPKPFRLVVHPHRIVEIKMLWDGRQYRVSSSLVRE